MLLSKAANQPQRMMMMWFSIQNTCSGFAREKKGEFHHARLQIKQSERGDSPTHHFFFSFLY
jgi:hypothetical protein